MSFTDTNKYVRWWFYILWNKPLAQIWVTTRDKQPGSKFQAKLVLHGLPPKWCLLEKAGLLSDGTSVDQVKI